MRSHWAARLSADLVVPAPRAYFNRVTSLFLTPSAASRVAFIAAKQGRPAVLRLAVDGGGCAGFSYRFEMGAIEEDDLSVETDGVTLVVDSVSRDLLDGSAVDYVEDLCGAAFKVTNPNAASGCGCGSSFSV